MVYAGKRLHLLPLCRDWTTDGVIPVGAQPYFLSPTKISYIDVMCKNLEHTSTLTGSTLIQKDQLISSPPP